MSDLSTKMPPKKTEKGKEKEKAGDFETVTYTSNQLRTTTTLLTVEDEAVIIKVLQHNIKNYKTVILAPFSLWIK